MGQEALWVVLFDISKDICWFIEGDEALTTIFVEEQHEADLVILTEIVTSIGHGQDLLVSVERQRGEII